MNAEHLARRLSDWVEQGLLSEAQRQPILDYERGRAAGTGRSWILYGLLLLGASVVGIGFVSLVAANWDEIPAGAKLAGAFAMLVALAWASHAAHRLERVLRFEVLSALLAIAVLGTIGLVAQVYHTGGELFMALAFWLVAIAPLALLARRGFLPQLWVTASLVTVVAWVFAEDWWERLGSVRLDEHVLWVLFLGIPLLCLLASNLTARRSSLALFSRAYGAWSVVGALVAVVAIDFIWSLERLRAEWGWPVPTIALAVLAAATLWLRDDLPGRARLVVVALIATASLASMPLITNDRTVGAGVTAELISALLTLLMLLLLAALFAARGARRWFNAMTLLVGVRFLVVYLQVIKDLALTGLGLVVSGLVIIGVALLWFKTRARVEAIFGGLVR